MISSYRKMFTFIGALIPFLLFGDAQINTSDLKNATEQTVDVEGGTLFCRVLGSGEPIIVIHDGPGLSQDCLLPKMQWLGRRGTTVFYDQRGCGQSTGHVNATTITLENYLSDIDAVRKAFQFKQTTLVGHGWGAFLALQYAIKNPDNVKQLILINPLPINSQDYASYLTECTNRRSAVQSQLDTLTESAAFAAGDSTTYATYYHLYYSGYFNNSGDGKKVNFYFSPTAALNGVQVATILNQAVFGGSFDFTNQVSHLNMPVLLVRGDADPVAASVVTQLKKQLNQADYVRIKNCGHFPYVEQQGDLFDGMRSFLKNNRS